MKKVLLFSLLLLAGLAGSQVLPALLGEAWAGAGPVLRLLTMIGLAFLMIHVGYEFEIEKTQLRRYGWDYVVAMTAAAFPWIFVTLYFVFVIVPPDQWWLWDIWKETLLAGRFAAPTSAGVLFAMLAAAGLSASWVFRKARILAIFDDLDTVLLMIPLKILMVGLAWQLGIIVIIMGVQLWIGWRWLHRIPLPVTWPWVIAYALGIAVSSELIYIASKGFDGTVPIHIEVLLPAFILGAVMGRPAGSDPHSDDPRPGHQEGPEDPMEQRVSTIMAAIFMVLVGLNMPAMFSAPVEVAQTGSVLAGLPAMPLMEMLMHVLAVTLLSNLGKMFPLFCYRAEAHWKERLAVSIGMWPRGEVGAGVLVVSLGYGIGGPVVSIAVISLALNLLLTGLFILAVRRLTPTHPQSR